MMLLMWLLLGRVWSAENPAWIEDPYKECLSSRELCVVGEASGTMLARAQARSEIAQFFQTQVSAKLKTAKGAQSSSTIVEATKVNESFSQEIETLTEDVLKGVSIKKKFEDEDTVYVLASLDKIQAAQRFSLEMDRLDHKMQALLKDDKRSHIPTLKKLFRQREELNRRYELLANKTHPEVVRFDDLEKRRRQFSSKKLKVMVAIEGEGKLKELESLVTKWLIEGQYKVVSKAQQAQLTLKGSVRSEKLFLDVKDWVKYKYVVDLYSLNAEGEKVGVLQFDVEQTGRSETQVYERAYPAVKKYISQHLDDLTLE